MAKTPVVKLLADGTIECAKGLGTSECGYKPGEKTCGKCGAVASTVLAPAEVKSEAVDGVGGEWVVDGEWVSADGEKVYPSGIPESKPTPIEVVTTTDDDDEFDETKEADEDRLALLEAEASVVKPDAEPTDDEALLDDDKMWNEVENIMAQRKKARAKRMESMGQKSLATDELAFVCARERTILSGGSPVCAQCTGGCQPLGDFPTLLEIEGIAESIFAGKVLDSGYADELGLFVIDVQRKDGKPLEAFFQGDTGELEGWHLLNEELIGEVAAIPGEKVISFSEASAIATKSIEGDVVSVDADMFNGSDAYAVEIEGIDGKSYDVYVGIDGELLGYDEYSADEASDIDAEVADLALKTLYDDETRAKMAEEGLALPDGSFPINNVADLQNAILSHSRASDGVSAKQHIAKRAKELDQSDLIPEEWNATNEATVLSDSEVKDFLGSVMEFEMMAIEAGINLDENDSK